ncbi:MAG: DHH family phosphoesterase [Acidobacteriota bacterium]
MAADESMLSSQIEKSLQRLLKLPLDEGKLLILTHDNPDPDCIASSAAMKFLLKEKRDIRATTAYSGIIGRAENRAMVRLLDLPMKHVSEIDFDDYRYIALIDAQPRTGNTAVPEERDVNIVIDHHPLREQTKESDFYEVAPALGATATLLTEYCRLLSLEIPKDLATALLYAIRSETQDLAREVCEVDLTAYQYLVPLSDPTKLSLIARPTLERAYYFQLAAALQSLLVGRHTAVCRLGEVNDPDFVPEMADLVGRMEDVQWTLAWGTHEDRMYFSIRTNDEQADAGAVMQKMISGLGLGGGHGMRAGGAVDLTSSSRSPAELAAMMLERFLEELGVDQKSMHPFEEGGPESD